MKQLKATIIFVCLAHIGFAQNFGGPKKGSAVGFSANLVDFSASVPKVGKLDPGFSLMYWQGITSHIDYSIRYNGLFTDYPKVAGVTNSYTNEFEGSLHARLLENNHLFIPFLTAGIGIGSYGKNTWAPYVPLGGGFQLNMFNEGYLFLQANYRATLAKEKLDNNRSCS
jgi:OOP family OmpA-OmpF porin